MTEIMRLNWGCAFDKYEGWLGSDVLDYGQEHVGDILNGLPWPDGTFDVVASHHALQIVKYVDMEGVLKEFHRVLKPGGRLRVSVPDVVRAFRAWEERDAAWFPVADDIQPTIDGKLSAYLTWYSEARSAFTWGYIDTLLEPIFYDHAIVDCGQSVLGEIGDCELDKRPNESIFFEAVK